MDLNFDKIDWCVVLFLLPLSFVNTMCAEPAQLFRNLQVLGADGYAVCSRDASIFCLKHTAPVFVGILTIRPVVTH